MNDSVTDVASLRARIARWDHPKVVAHFMGCIFLWSALGKAVHPADAEGIVRFLDSNMSASLAVKALVVVEAVLGGLLIAGPARRMILLLGLVLLLVFSGGLIWAKLRGFSGGCGCFGMGTSLESALARNAGLIALCIAGILSRRPRLTPTREAANERGPVGDGASES